MNQNRCEFAEYLLVLNPAFLSLKEHHISSIDIIGGIESLIVDILRFLEEEISFFGG